MSNYVGTYLGAVGTVPQSTTPNNGGSCKALSLPEQALYNATHRVILKYGDLGWQTAAATPLTLLGMPIAAGQSVECMQAKLVTPFACGAADLNITVGDNEGAMQFLTSMNLNSAQPLVVVGTRGTGWKYYSAADAINIVVSGTGAGLALSAATAGEVHIHLRVTDGNLPD